MKKVSVLCPYPIGLAPSQRFRIEAFIQNSNRKDVEFSIKPFLSETAYQKLYLPGHTIGKFFYVLIGFVKRIRDLMECHSSDFILIHREASPLGPPVFEWILAKVLKKKIIFDFDDAIWLKNTSDQNKITASLKWSQKFNSICKWSYKIAAGNAYLAQKAKEFNNNVILLPTVVNTDKSYIPQKQNSNQITIGWTGSHSTSSYVNPILPVLKKLHDKHPFRFLFISNQPPDFSLPFLDYRKWNKENEIRDLNEIDIGIMPLQVDEWTKGKCGFKLIQYQALEIPAVATNLPPNDKIILQNSSGFLCNSDEEWLQALEKLINNKDLRGNFGKTGRERIIKNYSIGAYSDTFFRLFS
ncbi:MAG: glycosyltransferase [Cytophagales bacterium]